MSFRFTQVLRIVALIEQDLDVNRFATGGVHLWPAARFLVIAKLMNNIVADEERPPEFRLLDRMIDTRWEQTVGSQEPPDLPYEAFTVPAGPVRDGHKGLLLFSRFEDHTIQTSQGRYNPLVDPWYEIAAPHWPVVKAEFEGAGFDKSQLRIVPTVAWARASAMAPDLALLQMAGALAAEVARWLERELRLPHPGLVEEFQQHVHALWSEKQTLGAQLDRHAPGLVLTTCCYFRPTMSIVWAARERGIPVVDIQHGANGPAHMGYTHWRNVPPGGYALLPDYYFTWDTISANNVVRWMPEGARNHQPVITGRFDLDVTRDVVLGAGNNSPLALAAYGSAQVILVTLQWHKSLLISPIMLEAMRRAPADWTWLIRSHPMSVGWDMEGMGPTAIEALLRANGIQRFECRLATGLPLGAVLPVATHHLTGFSGTVQEASAFGLRTTFTHPSARQAFGRYLDAGVAEVAETADEILVSITKGRIDSAMAKVTVMPRDPELPHAVLKGILG